MQKKQASPDSSFPETKRGRKQNWLLYFTSRQSLLDIYKFCSYFNDFSLLLFKRKFNRQTIETFSKPPESCQVRPNTRGPVLQWETRSLLGETPTKLTGINVEKLGNSQIGLPPSYSAKAALSILGHACAIIRVCWLRNLTIILGSPLNNLQVLFSCIVGQRCLPTTL